MVSLGQTNAYALREHLATKAAAGAEGDLFKILFQRFLKLLPQEAALPDASDQSLYLRCAISGLSVIPSPATVADLSRLLGQASKIDGTPRPWVSDTIGVLAIKWFADAQSSDDINRQYSNWVAGFLKDQISSNHLNAYEKDLAKYVFDGEAAFATALVPLALHHLDLKRVSEHKDRQALYEKFLAEFHKASTADLSAQLLALFVFVFDRMNEAVALAPPKGWSLFDLVNVLDHISVGLKNWTWETQPRTKNSDAVQWKVQNEYHVQNLLYVLLAPTFNDIVDELYLDKLGQKTPRVDLYLPSMHVIVEVKFRKNSKKSFQDLIGEVAEDASLYRSDKRFADAKLVCFLWDHTRSTQEHTKFKEGVLKIVGIDACVVVSSPSTMD